MHKTLMLFALLSLPACAGKQAIVTTPRVECSRLVPEQWGQGVEAAPIPIDTPVTIGSPLTEAVRASIVAPWATAYLLMSAALEKANGRTADTITIVQGCETAVKR